MSAPHSNGRIRYGVATVLSTISGTPAAWATPATPSMSRMSLARVGDRLARRTPWCWAARPPATTRGRSGWSTKETCDAQLGQRVVEQVVRAAVQARAGDQVVAGLDDVQDRQRLGGLTAADAAERADAALERRDALLHDRLRRVHDPGVDVAGLGEPEQRARVVAVAEGVGGRLVDREGPRIGWPRPAPGRRESAWSRSSSRCSRSAFRLARKWASSTKTGTPDQEVADGLDVGTGGSGCAVRATGRTVSDNRARRRGRPAGSARRPQGMRRSTCVNVTRASAGRQGARSTTFGNTALRQCSPAGNVGGNNSGIRYSG